MILQLTQGVGFCRCLFGHLGLRWVPNLGTTCLITVIVIRKEIFHQKYCFCFWSCAASAFIYSYFGEYPFTRFTKHCLRWSSAERQSANGSIDWIESLAISSRTFYQKTSIRSVSRSQSSRCMATRRWLVFSWIFMVRVFGFLASSLLVYWLNLFGE